MNNGWLENQYGLFPAGIFVLFFIVQCKVTQHVIYYKITQRAVLCTPGLKALADTVCTERCIAFNGGTPHFVFFFLETQACGVRRPQDNMPDKRQETLAMREAQEKGSEQRGRELTALLLAAAHRGQGDLENRKTTKKASQMLYQARFYFAHTYKHLPGRLKWAPPLQASG